MPSTTVQANVTSTPPLTVDQFYSIQPITPGNVGVCLSGGGSRALTAGMGQLQALSQLNLLGQVKAISTVSGGSWLGVPFEFLPSGGPSDNAFLGVYVTNPGNITLAQLGQLPSGNAAVPLTADWFSPEMLALSAFVLWAALDVPADMLWQTLIGLNILSNENLFQPGADLAPTDMFSYDEATLKAIVADNPALASETAYLVASTTSQNRVQRPFLICNMAMFMNEPDTDFQLLAPVQVTPFMAGIVGAPQGKDANGLAPGGGGVTSFAFNSIFLSRNGNAVTADQTRQWSLTDSAGTSSAFFAEIIANQFAVWEQNIWSFLETLGREIEAIIKWIESHLPLHAQLKAKAFVQRHAAVANAKDLAAARIEFPILSQMIPQYYYWPASQNAPVSNPQPTQFADGGNLDNTGVAAMAAYSDIQSIISFTNTSVPLSAGQYGVSNGSGGFIAGTYVIVDETIPPLFGYQPYNSSGPGYVPYAGVSSPTYPQYAHSQIFDSAEFPAVLQGLWASSGSSADKPATSPAVFSQPNLKVLENRWFGVTGGQTVTVVWNYLNYAQDWVNLFNENPPVANAIAQEVQNNSFPNYSTLQTQLSAIEVNLLAILTGWSVVSTDQHNGTFSSLFAQSSSARAGD